MMTRATARQRLAASALLSLSLFAPLALPQLPPAAITVTAVASGAGTTTTNIAPGGIITITGTNFATAAASVGDPTGGALPTTLGGVRVMIGGVMAPLFMVSPTMITAQVPFEVPVGAQPLVVTAGTASGPSIPVTVAATAPVLFSDASGGIIAKGGDYSLVGAANPAQEGDVLVLFGTGLGQASPVLRTGAIVEASASATPTAPVSVTIGGQAAELVYSLAAPGFAGLYQIAVRMPAGLVGTVPVALQAAGASAPAITLIAGPERAARLDPEVQAVVTQYLALGPRPIQTLTPEQARRQPSAADAVRALLRQQGRSTDPEPVGRVEDRNIPGGAGPIQARFYTPQGTGPFPVIVYFHGGGFVIATIDTYDASARALANAAGAIVVSVEYRKAPENPFPAAPEDAYAATQWVMANAASFNGLPNRVAVAGESAGGNLATVTCLLARDRRGRMPVHQLLVYPVTNLASESPTYEENGDAPFLTRDGLRWFGRYYLPTRLDATDRDASPLLAPDVSGLPPATIITAGIDPLRDEGAAYADKLRQAGIAVDYRNYAAAAHEFFGMGAVVEVARQAVQQAGANLRAAFGQ